MKNLSTTGRLLYGLATMVAGILDLIWGEFEAAHQPVGALGDHIPGLIIYAYITAIWMILAGAAILWRRTIRAGALASVIIYLVFGLFWVPRFITVPPILGFSLSVFTGLLAGIFTELIVVAGGLLLYAAFTSSVSSRLQKYLDISRWIFGLGAIFFGLGHLTGIKSVASMIPKWMPFGGSFWVVLTGIAFLLAGLAILSRILNLLAARLLALMLLIFEIILIPPVFVYPHSHIAWGSNAYSLAAAGAVWIFAATIAGKPTQRDRHFNAFIY